MTKKNLHHSLQKYQDHFFPVMGDYAGHAQMCLIDLSERNESLKKVDFADTQVLDRFIFGYLKQQEAKVGVGGYMEKRIIYSRSEVFGGIEARNIHLGIDLWAPAFTPIYCPLEGSIRSVKDNKGFGDYGPTLILEHQLDGFIFYTLYGHLSRQSIKHLREGQKIRQGISFSELGPPPENGDWPPHLHFQIITDIDGKEGDFPGVAAPSDLEKFKKICPDPNLILNIPLLK